MAVPDLRDHLCQECHQFGSHGFGPPSLDATIRWYCGEHQRMHWYCGVHQGISTADEPI